MTNHAVKNSLPGQRYEASLTTVSVSEASAEIERPTDKCWTGAITVSGQVVDAEPSKVDSLIVGTGGQDVTGQAPGGTVDGTLVVVGPRVNNGGFERYMVAPTDDRTWNSLHD